MTEHEHLEISADEQLIRWMHGESVHRDVPGSLNGECVPDFSCCRHELASSVAIRKAFFYGSETLRKRFTNTFLAALIVLEYPECQTEESSSKERQISFD